MDQVIKPDGFDENLSPEAFHRWAEHYYQCKQDFRIPGALSPVPYFLLCHAIELELKSRFLHKKNREEVKKKYRHNLKKAYSDLDSDMQTLEANEVSTLEAASAIYAGKGFEYFDPEHAARGYSQFPDLAALDTIAAKLIRGSRAHQKFHK
jgi:hypothetical protein